MRSTRIQFLILAATMVGGLAVSPVSASAAACGSGPGSCTQADVNTSIDNALTYFDANQNSNGSWGVSEPGAETALVLGAYGVKGYANLTPTEQTIVQNGLNWLLSTQCDASNPTPPAGCGSSDGSFDNDSLKTYDTGTALLALSLLSDVPTTRDKPTAISDGRTYLINHQVITANGYGPCTPGGTSAQGGGYCGGWDYPCCGNRSDESNTGFGLTGLDLTGGVPASVAASNVGWQQNVQQLSTNPGGFLSRNDGGGAYVPGVSSGDFSSNANDNGSLLFGYGYDQVPATDPGVQAAIKIAQDTFDVYETPGAKANRVMVFHSGMTEDGSCDPAVSGCDWGFGTGEGGYHYSIFALVKGLSQYITPNLTDSTNFYAKAVDLLLGQQCSGGSCGAGKDGSWPADLRDDGSVFGATGFAVLALGRVGAPPDQPITATGTAVNATEGTAFTGTVATFTDPDSASTAGEYSATIDWGDGTTTPNAPIGGSAGNFTVTGTHTYQEQGSFTVKVTITDVDNTPNSATPTTTANVADAALKASSAQPSKSKLTVSGTFATFTDNNPFAKASDNKATINWGDGTTSSGTVSAGTGRFLVTGSHTYKKTGSHKITVTIVDDGGSTATASQTVTFVSRIVHGSAQLRGVPARCVSSALALQVAGKRIASVTWTVNGRRITGRKVHNGTRYSATILSSPGAHHVAATVRFVKASRTSSRTLRATVTGCALPAFTG